MNVIGHDHERKQLVSLAVKIEKSLFHDSAYFRNFQTAASVTGIKVLIDFFPKNGIIFFLLVFFPGFGMSFQPLFDFYFQLV